MEQNTSHVVVGVVPGQPPAVVVTAAIFARHFRAHLVCAWVDAARYTLDTLQDGTVVSMNIDPELADESVESVDPALRASISEALHDRDVPWSVRALAGGPAQELSRLADELDAAMIVVGTREPGVRGTLHEFFGGSVAAQLAHRQHRPVLVVPLDPVGLDGRLPWDQEHG